MILDDCSRLVNVVTLPTASIQYSVLELAKIKKVSDELKTGI
jgi:hypothetical protein